MKLPNLNNWGSDQKIENLLFFAQVVDEMLFHFTIDSYKPKIFNTHGSLIELSFTLNNSKSFQFGKNGINGHVKPILNELSKKFSEDTVAKKIISEVYGDEGLKIIQYKITNWSDQDEYTIFVESLEGIFKKNYLPAVKAELISAISNCQNYSDIRYLADSFVSELLLKGFSQEYLYYSTQSFFFQENIFKDEKNTSEYLERFFALFPDKKRKWDVVLRVSKEFNYIPEYSNSDLFTLFTEDMEPRTAEIDEIKFIREKPHYAKRNYPFFLVAKDYHAYDPYAAKNSINTILNFYNDSLKFSTYYLRLKWDDYALVYSEDGNLTVTRKSVPPLSKNKKFANYVPHDLDTHDIDLSEICKNKEKILLEKLDYSGYSLFKSLSLHGSAINSKNLINQYLNIWIALETLLPRKNGISISNNINSVYLPIMNKNYIRKLIEAFQNDLEHYLLSANKGDLNEFFSDFPERLKSLSGPFLKCSALLAINEDEYDCISVATQKIGRNPLLIHRMHELNNMISSTTAIRSTIQGHSQRMEWHLLRLFRIRNRLMHQGDQIIVLDRLLENINFYYHTAIEEIEMTSEMHQHIDSLDKIFMWIQLEHDAHMKILSNNKKVGCTYDNFRTLLFGKV